VLRRDADAPVDLREKSLCIAARVLELTGKIAAPLGYRAAQQALDSGAAEKAMQRIIDAQGPRPFPPEARYRCTVAACEDGPIREIDCWQLARVAKHAGAPANVSAGLWLHKTVGDVVSVGDPLFEIHAQTESQLEFARTYAECREGIVRVGIGRALSPASSNRELSRRRAT
jgi:thymidine phosphorylase